MTKKETYLLNHPYKITRCKDGWWCTHVKDRAKKDGRRIIRKHTKEELEDALYDFYEHPFGDPTLQDIFYEWDRRRVEIGKISQGTFVRDEHIFKKHCADLARRKISDITELDIEDLLEEQVMKYKMTSKSFSGLKSVVRGMFKRAKRRRLTNIDIVSLINNLDTTEISFKKTIKEDYEEVYSEEETEKMLSYLKEHADILNLSIAFIFYTGVRVGELVALKPEDLTENTVRIRRQETRTRSKSGKASLIIKDSPKTVAGNRTIVIPRSGQWVLKRIKLLNPFGEYLFMNGGKRVTAQDVRRRLKKICLELDIYPKPPHKIRKTYGSILLDNNVDRNFIKEQMGHTDILVTEQHYHRNRRSFKEKEEILSEIADFF